MTALIETLNAISASWWPLLWKSSWQGGLALLFVFALWRAPAQLRCWLWRLAFLKLLIVGVWAAPVELPWLSARSVNPATQAAIPSAASRELNSPPSEVPALRESTARPATRAAHLTPASWMLIGWIAGVGACLVRFGRRWIRLHRLVARLQPVTDESLVEALVGHCRSMGVRRLPGLRRGEASTSPFLVGSIRPLIVLPGAVLHLSTASQRDAALLHELAHIKRRDLLWNWLPALAEMLFFFHPFVWLARREWRLAQEIAADELAVARSQTSIAEYARSLLELIARCPVAVASSHLAISMSPAFYQLERRMIAMQSFRPETIGRRGRLAALITAIAVLGIVPWKLVAQEAATTPAANEIVPAVATQTPDDTVAESADNVMSGNVRGVVLDPEGRPVAGATVLAGTWGKTPVRQMLRTDAEGRFETQFSRKDRPLVVAYREGMALASQWFTSETEPVDLELRLHRPASFVGRVLDAQGNPVPQAQVRAELFATGGRQRYEGWNHLLESILSESEFDRHVVTTTDADGQFHFSTLPENADVMLKVRADGWGLLRTMGLRPTEKQFLRGTAEEPAVVTLPPEGVIEGRIVTALPGVSVAGLTVALQASQNTPVIPEPYFVSTDSEGRFRFNGLNGGTANVYLIDHEPDGPWTYSAAADVPVIAGETASVEIELIKGQLVTGEVVDPDGEPVAGAYVGLHGPIRPDSGAAIIGDTTKADGKYRFHLPPGAARIYLSGKPPGYTGRDGGFIEVGEGEGTLSGPTLTVRPTIGLRGRILGSDNEPATDVKIVRVSNTWRFFDYSQHPITVDAEGRFTLRRDDPVDIAAGEQLELRIDRGGEEISVEVVPTGDEEIEIILPD
jgi:beta-lactamase regulating signal transducer with metallopeptidase domain/protocatechuate 3,4-dioxygenase beta subunit